MNCKKLGEPLCGGLRLSPLKQARQPPLLAMYPTMSPLCISFLMTRKCEAFKDKGNICLVARHRGQSLSHWKLGRLWGLFFNLYQGNGINQWRMLWCLLEGRHGGTKAREGRHGGIKGREGRHRGTQGLVPCFYSNYSVFYILFSVRLKQLRV